LAKRILSYLGDHALAAVALACSLLALAGSSYAAFTISGSQIRNGTIDPVKLNPRFIAGSVRAWARVRANGSVVAGGGLASRSVPPTGNIYLISWKPRLSGRCATVASVDSVASPPTEAPNLRAGYASASTSGNPRTFRFGATSAVMTFDQQGHPTPLAFDVAVVC
jgi:hypothetical protein